LFVLQIGANEMSRTEELADVSPNARKLYDGRGSGLPANGHPRPGAKHTTVSGSDGGAKQVQPAPSSVSRLTQFASAGVASVRAMATSPTVAKRVIALR
jgi:hypothetical protein